MKKEKSFTYSVRIPPGYAKVIGKCKEYLSEHPDLVGKTAGKIIFDSDVFRYALDLLADALDVEFKIEKAIDIEIIDPIEKRNRNIDETNLCRILSSKDFKILEEYLHSDEEYKDKMTVFEFCDYKGIDWVSLLRAETETSD